MRFGRRTLTSCWARRRPRTRPEGPAPTRATSVSSMFMLCSARVGVKGLFRSLRSWEALLSHFLTSKYLSLILETAHNVVHLVNFSSASIVLSARKLEVDSVGKLCHGDPWPKRGCAG